MIVRRAMLLIALGAAPAHADNTYDGADWAWSLGAGTGGALVGGAALAGLGVALTDDQAGFEALGALLIGLPLGSMIGGTAGAWLYGDLSGHETRWWAPVVGGLVGGGLGLAGFIGSAGIDNDFGAVLAVSSILILPALGATTGYALGLTDTASAGTGPRLTLAPVPARGGWSGVVGLAF